MGIAGLDELVHTAPSCSAPVPPAKASRQQSFHMVLRPPAEVSDRFRQKLNKQSTNVVWLRRHVGDN
jgi:hypothetical protein